MKKLTDREFQIQLIGVNGWSWWLCLVFCFVLLIGLVADQIGGSEMVRVWLIMCFSGFGCLGVLAAHFEHQAREKLKQLEASENENHLLVIDEKPKRQQSRMVAPTRNYLDNEDDDRYFTHHPDDTNY